MSENVFAFATKMTDELDKAVTQKAVTGFFADNQLRQQFVGAKTVMIPSVSLSGLGDYDRDGGFTDGTVTVSAKPHVLEMDRGRSFQLDREDCDESGIADLAGQIMGEFVRTQVVPEVDAYVLSSACKQVEITRHFVEGAVESECFEMLNEAISGAQDAVGYDEELVAFVDSRTWSSFQMSKEISSMLVTSDFAQGDITVKRYSYNGIPIIPVQNSRMKRDYNFYDGVSEGQQNGGFEPALLSPTIGLLLMPRRAASLIKKTEQIRVFDPAHNQQADAWKVDYRLFYDVVFNEKLVDGIYAYIY